MKYANARAIEAHVNKGVVTFHHMRFESLREAKPQKILKKKDLHLLKARNICVVGDLVRILVDDLVSCSDKTIFRRFLDDIAVFVAGGEKPRTESAPRELQAGFAYRGNDHTVHLKLVSGFRNVSTTWSRGYRRVMGRDFRYRVSNDRILYTSIIEPLGVRAKEHNQHFLDERARIINVLARQFTDDFCDDGRINWKRLVEFNSGPLKMPRRKTSRKK